jgi:chromosome segregation ATPase
MSTKIKILLIGLAALCAFALIIAFQLNAVNKALRNDFALREQEFANEKKTLNQQLASALESKKKLDAELGDLKVKFDSMTKERNSLKDKFDIVTKERASLVEKVQSVAKKNKDLEEEVEKLKKAQEEGKGQEGGGQASISAPTDDAYWANVLKDKAALEIQVKQLNAQFSDLQLKAERAMEEGRKLDMQNKTVIDTKTDLERRVIYNEKLAETLSEDLVREKRDKKAISDQIDTLRQENYEMKSRLVALGDKKSSLETRLVDLQQEREILSKRLAELDQIMNERVDQIIQVKDDLRAAKTQATETNTKDSRVVQLQPIVVKAAEELPMRKSMTAAAGQVLAINEDNNFVIIDLGEDDGAKVGQILDVVRNSQKIASVEIIQTRKEISAADIKSVASGTKIKVGDIIS